MITLPPTPTQQTENSLSAPLWHFGHLFSQAMPEVASVLGRPLADALHPNTPKDLDDYTDAMETLINALKPGDIVFNHRAMPADLAFTSDQEKVHYLLDALAAFYESECEC